MLCFYHDDLDGRCAAAIVGRHACETRYMPAGYHWPLPVGSVTDGETVVVVDFTPSPSDFDDLRRRAGRVVWIDHHASSIERADLVDLPGLREIGRAACELAWQFYFPEQDTPRAVQLAADRDVWAWKYAEQTAAFCEGIRLEPHDPGAEIWHDLLGNNPVRLQSVINQGHVCRRYQKALAAEFVAAYGFETELDGHRGYAANLNMFGSDVFGDRFDQYDICIAFVFTGKLFKITMYSREIDVLPIARRFGGGGHHGAAGFTCKALPFEPVAG